ncbi:unnamed protein product [Macrosiphum euphorbiae]|uniref:Uncharacterized protein n=1 Tax=Macrosiphum euphorbiae TaxID=13131 RepID=A0AAV0VPE2_9HEMI|nr:unnamed protein product [Macrosiphum euphorbiae]
MDAEENKRKRSEKRLRLGRHSIHPTPPCGGVARSLFSVCVCAEPTLHRWRRVNEIIIMGIYERRGRCAGSGVVLWDSRMLGRRGCWKRARSADAWVATATDADSGGRHRRARFR